ncbi:MAG: hypothetical protein Ct9H90mP10_10630 [Actinomycetota bacterium]|nr:MAG: hypothetical protein Ct9H90mP10_10630 [Actinomycetota bacterium]
MKKGFLKKKFKKLKKNKLTIENFKPIKLAILKLFQEKIVNFFKSDSFENPNSLD